MIIMNKEKITERIRLWGIVQGVGFRPFVAKIAAEMNMKGTVSNIGGLVEIEVTDTAEQIESFVKSICDRKPVPAEIVHIAREPMEYEEFSTFHILHSEEGDDDIAMIPSDISICPDCLAELKEQGNERYRHPFISCMVCGPRYTIIDKIPYDRDNTAMIDWPMCDFCEEEYTSLEDRRYHAQTISCHNCGPVLLMKDDKDKCWEREIAIEKAAEKLAQGKVIAFKGVGGYNLIADPLQSCAVEAVRNIKEREQKPFAVMFRDMEEIKSFCHVSETEEKLLLSSAKPIMLLEHRGKEEMKKAGKGKSIDEFCKSRFIGAFLPSMGAQHLILEAFGGPLISTSANVSGMPMVKDDDEMMELMRKKQGISAIVYNERDIRVRVDDSVVRVIDNQPQIIRRSKGYAPVPLFIDSKCDKSNMILATGGQLKNSFALTKGSFSYVSQYFGDLDSIENQQIYRENISRMEEIFRINPNLIVCDMHPAYETTIMAEKMDGEKIKAQHHHAHIASVMAEHNIKGPVIGVSFDGTGYGTDGNVWGGEILLCEGSSFKRLEHLKYIDMIGGDISMKEAWKSALCYQYAYDKLPDKGGDDEFKIDITNIIEYAEKRNWPMLAENKEVVYKALEHKINTVTSSSMGRLFDAVAALLGIKMYNDYEGQCAIMLEDAAASCESEEEKLAYEFHMQVAKSIIESCRKAREKTGTSNVALSGGVFQNKILMEETIKKLKKDKFNVYYNISVSPNDGGIALGQSYIGIKVLEERKNGN